MLESKALEEINFQDVQDFVDLRLEETTRLDYKQEITRKLPLHVCAMANTQGGHILIGIAEEESERGELKLNVPKSMIPGVKHDGKDLRAKCRDMIAACTNPRLIPEIKVIPVNGSETQVVIVIRVEPGVNAPHELDMNDDPRVVVRRSDSSRSATLDEIERLIERRNRAQQESFGQLEISSMSGGFRRGYHGEFPPMLSVLLRPRRVAAVSFNPSHMLDQNLKNLALELDLMEQVHVLPIPQGSALEERAGSTPSNHTFVRLEAYGNGEIRAARALEPETTSYIDSSGGQEKAVTMKKLGFVEIVHFLQRTVLFASRAHKLENRELEMEAYFELGNCSGYRVKIPAVSRPRPLGSAHAEIRGKPVSVATIGKEPNKEILLPVVRETSRVCGLSVPDWRLEEYVLDVGQS